MFFSYLIGCPHGQTPPYGTVTNSYIRPRTFLYCAGAWNQTAGFLSIDACATTTNPTTLECTTYTETGGQLSGCTGISGYYARLDGNYTLNGTGAKLLIAQGQGHIFDVTGNVDFESGVWLLTVTWYTSGGTAYSYAPQLEVDGSGGTTLNSNVTLSVTSYSPDGTVVTPGGQWNIISSAHGFSGGDFTLSADNSLYYTSKGTTLYQLLT